jgi:hypothetical protein
VRDKTGSAMRNVFSKREKSLLSERRLTGAVCAGTGCILSPLYKPEEKEGRRKRRREEKQERVKKVGYIAPWIVGK